MTKSKLMAIGAQIASLATLAPRPRKTPEASRAVGVGTVRTVAHEESEAGAGERQIWIEVSSVHGDTFIGRLMHHDVDADLAALRPGLVVLVAFDPTAREQLSLPDDALAVRARGLALV
ncbi:hypothetical protein [Mycobacterium asiaticum]|uniref:Uncharacterized protein n=1 Tax=Mycobacterium asiaticum TaxID=1790 RepID=A0A1A3N6V1_MYCAS|nr:hypothetical protein [Mycobacterium asiaticum]OBK17070.1 hypothetical protein A5636_23400 [Mycobacterium asiaticum]